MRLVERDPGRLLVIDDSEAIQRLVEARLRPDGLAVSGEIDPGRGIERAVDEVPDVILLDVELPGLDGFEVCRQLKANAITRNIPVIFLSATSDVDARVRGLDLGAVDFVAKPFDRFELRARVRAALRTRRMQEDLERQSFVDGLTGLWNRAFFDQRFGVEIEVAQRYGRPLCLAIADVDRFKQINDTHGHPFGDTVLQAVAEVFRGHARASDVVARFGGEEFAILMAATDGRVAARIVERLRAALEALRLECHGRPIAVTASFGVVCSEDLDADPSAPAILSAADRALYASKHAGRNSANLWRRGGAEPIDSDGPDAALPAGRDRQ